MVVSVEVTVAAVVATGSTWRGVRELAIVTVVVTVAIVTEAPAAVVAAATTGRMPLHF